MQTISLHEFFFPVIFLTFSATSSNLGFYREFCGKFLRIEFHWGRQVLCIRLPARSTHKLFLKICALHRPFSWRPSCHLVLYTPFWFAYRSQCRHRSSYLTTIVFMMMTAAVLAEICSALPLCGSIYIWAAESAGPKYARFFGFIVAWWSCTAWMTFTAGNCQVLLDPHIMSLPHLIFFLEHCKLYRLSICRLGNRVSWGGW